MKIQLTLEEIAGVAQAVYAATLKHGGAPAMAWRVTHSIAQRLGASQEQAYTLTRAARRASAENVPDTARAA
ncbi:MAG: hypothetical protein M3380_13870 [Chloroflexota bacterium]|nr:hypothetical protein [Chloroflexota bacterium]